VAPPSDQDLVAVSHPDDQPGAAPANGAIPEWRPSTPRLGPALIVVALVAFIAIGGGLLAVLGTSHSHAPTIGKSANGLGVESAKTAFKPIVGPDNPPSDVVAAIVLPESSERTSYENYDGGQSTYDRSATFAVAQSPKTVVNFYVDELKRAGWGKVSNFADTSGGTQLFATREGSDGYYWQIGVKIDQASGSISASLAGDTNGPTSTFVIRLEEVDDSD
jgi:hypothetical protein